MKNFKKIISAILIATLFLSLLPLTLTFNADEPVGVKVEEEVLPSGARRLVFSVKVPTRFKTAGIVFSYDNTVILPVQNDDQNNDIIINDGDLYEYGADDPITHILIPDPFKILNPFILPLSFNWQVDGTRTAFFYTPSFVTTSLYCNGNYVPIFEFYYRLADGKTAADLNSDTFKFESGAGIFVDNFYNNTGNGYGVVIGEGSASIEHKYIWGAQATATEQDTLDLELPLTYENSTVLVKQDPQVTWPTGLTATYGDALSSVTLPGNGTSTPAGVFTWTTPTALVGNAGTQSHSMTFTPNDSNYNTMTQLVDITVNKAVYNGNTTVPNKNVVSNEANTGDTVTLPGLPAGAVYGVPAASGTGLVTNAAVSGTTLTFDVTAQADGFQEILTIPVTGATNFLDYNVVVTVIAKDIVYESTPNASIDYINERLTGLEPNAAHTVNGVAYQSSSNGTIAINPAWIGQTINVVKVGVAPNVDSLPQTIVIDARPDVPAPGKTDTTDGNANGTITDVDDTMEYKLSTSSVWIPITDTTVTGLAAGTYNIRVKATATEFASESVNVTIAPSGSPVNEYTIYSYAGTGGTVSGGGTYNAGATVTLKATPNSNYSFDGWYEDGIKIVNAGAVYTFTASSNRTLEARFTYTPDITNPVPPPKPVTPIYTPIVIGYSITQPTISEKAVEYDKNKDGDIVIRLSLGNSVNGTAYILHGLKNNSKQLVKGTDYTFEGNEITIKASYLKTLKSGEQTINFLTNSSVNPKLTLKIIDTTP